MAASVPGSRSLGALFKRGWKEIPEVVGSSFMAIIGIGMGFIGLYRLEKSDGHNKRFKFGYVVYRPDDPRVTKVRKD